MKILHYEYQGKDRYGSIEDDLLKVIEKDIFSDFKVTDKTILLKDVKILPPVIPSKIVAAGLNYAKHKRLNVEKGLAYDLLFIEEINMLAKKYSCAGLT